MDTQQQQLEDFYATAKQGLFFSKKAYEKKPLPTFAQTRDKLPRPIFENDPAYIDCYWKAWELAFRNFYEPQPGSGMVSQFIDAAFDNNIFMWDTCFMTLFCNYASPYVPSICSLDNFYALQYQNGEICRQSNRETGRAYFPWNNFEKEPLFSRYGFGCAETGKASAHYIGRQPPVSPPYLTLDALNHPVLAWAELESFRVTGDRERFSLIWEPLKQYYHAFQNYVQQGNGLYMGDWASMDNSPRNYLTDNGGTIIDASAEMVLFARCLSEIAGMLDKQEDSNRYLQEALALSDIINEKMWDPNTGFYYDLTYDEQKSNIKTIAGFWPLLAGIASPQQAQALAAHLQNPKTFHTPHRVPTLAMDADGFEPTGGYWCGAVWDAMNTMVIKGLLKYGYEALAHEIAMEHLRYVVSLFKQSGTIYENYSPMTLSQGNPAKPDFVGFSGIAPIAYLLEFAIGLRPDAAQRRLTWHLTQPCTVGVEQYWFAGNTYDFLCSAPDASGHRELRIRGDGSCQVDVFCGEKSIRLAARPNEEIVCQI